MFTKDLITEIQDLRHLKWTKVRKSSGTAGSYLKAYGEEKGRKIYYKLSCYDQMNGITGHESVNELIVDRLLTLFGIDHIHYQLIHGKVEVESEEYDTWICASEDFKEKGDSKIPLDDLYEISSMPGEGRMDFCIRMGWEEYIYRMLAVDFIILNRDRHGANIEIIKKAGNKDMIPAPLFDHGLSLLFNCHSEAEAEAFDPAADKAVQCFVGGRSASANLDLIPKNRKPKLKLHGESAREFLFAGLDEILPTAYLDKIWEMITERLKYYESL